MVALAAQPLVWTPRRVIECAAEAFGVDEDNLLGPLRYKPLVGYRQVAYAAVKHFCGLSGLQTAKVFGRDHTTVAYGIQRVESDEGLRDLFCQLAARLLQEGVA